jgi:CHAT domain-containing protein
MAAQEPARTRSHLLVAERIVDGQAFRSEPLIASRFRREFARLRIELGDIVTAERLLGQALPALERADPAAAAEAVNARGTARLELLRLREAATDFERSVLLWRRAATGSVAAAEYLVAALTNLAIAQAEAGEIEAARNAAERARLAAGGDPRLLRAADFATAKALLRALDIVSAETLLERVAADSDPGDPLRGHALLTLATARFDRGRMPEAVEAATSAVEAYRATLGERHPAIGRALHSLGTARLALGDLTGGSRALLRASEVLRVALGTNSVQVQATELELGWIDLRAGDLAAVERRARAALAAFTAAPPPDRRPEGLATVLLGLAAEAQGRNDVAADHFRRGQMLIARARGPSSPDLGFSLVRLGRLLTRAERHGEAAPPLDRAIAIYEGVGGAGTVRLAEAITARAELRSRAGQRRGALEDTRRGFALLRERVGGSEAAGEASADVQRRGARELFVAQARLLLELLPGDMAAMEEAFTASQASLSSRAGEALRRAAARRATGEGELGQLLRTQQTAADALAQIDALFLATTSRPGSDAAREASRLREAREEQALRLRRAGEALASSFPAFASFLSPKPVSLSSVRGALSEDEALLAPVVSEEGLLLWVVRRGIVQAIPVQTRAAELADLVRRVRTGVDLGLLNRQSRLSNFDTEAARALYGLLVAPAEAAGLLNSVQHLVLVPDGALQSLPPHLLLDTEERWLVRRFAVTVAPSAAALVAAREAAQQPSRAPMAFLGVGNPVFDGYSAPAQLARRGPPERLRLGLAQLGRLDETAEEVRRIAEFFPEAESRLVLGEAATERGVLEARPDQYRTISFSTHALMAGELPGLTEPAIVLTADDDDAPMDGLLTASDVATLELDADLVLLSACNTAAPDAGPFAEGLSGLARAFLQAGARSLLVSHWSVASHATVELTTGFIAVARAEPGRRRAEALRDAMLRMADGPDPQLRHPAFWAAFVVVGG